MTHSVFAELTRVLTRLRDIYAELESIFSEEREALISFNFEALKALNDRKEAISTEVNQLEVERTALFDDMRLMFHLPETVDEDSGRPRMKLTSLVPRIPESHRVEIVQVSEDLEDRVNRCREKHVLNQRFMEHSLRNIRLLKKNWSENLGAAQSTTTYSKGGRIEPTSGTVLRKKV